MSEAFWDELRSWASRADDGALEELRLAAEEGLPEVVEVLYRHRGLADAGERPPAGPVLPTVLSVVFWRLHGVPFTDSPYHHQLLDELRMHLVPMFDQLEQVLGPDLLSALSDLPPPPPGELSSQVAWMSDLVVCSGRSDLLELPSVEDASALHWLCKRLEQEGSGTCHVAPSRYQRLSLLLGGRSKLVLPDARTLPVVESEVLSDDEVHLVLDSGDYREVYVPPAPLRGDVALSSEYALLRRQGNTPAETLSAMLS